MLGFKIKRESNYYRKSHGHSSCSSSTFLFTCSFPGNSKYPESSIPPIDVSPINLNCLTFAGFQLDVNQTAICSDSDLHLIMSHSLCIQWSLSSSSTFPAVEEEERIPFELAMKKKKRERNSNGKRETNCTNLYVILAEPTLGAETREGAKR